MNIENEIPSETIETGGIAGDVLRSYIDRIERLEEEKAGIAADIREIFAEAKGGGFDTAVMRQILKIRKMEPHDVAEQDELLELYKRALSMPIN
ncbi:DUF2312 domain-containing protein [Tistrella bauzanensis]|uniref:DUF2312 domain-containing protein n=1 Tax=Tistrella TaxID=171436 RepID=UPI0031F706E2